MNGAVSQQGARFFQNEGGHVAQRRGLRAAGVDFFLAFYGNGLIGRQRVDGKKAGGVPGEAIDRHHAYPRIHAIQYALRLALQQPAPQPFNRRQRARVIKGEQIFAFKILKIVPRYFCKAFLNIGQSGRVQARGAEQARERVDVIAKRRAPKPRGFNGRGAAPHEGVVDGVARFCQAFDEEGGQLRLEAGAVADFVQPHGLALARGPELARDARHAAHKRRFCAGRRELRQHSGVHAGRRSRSARKKCVPAGASWRQGSVGSKPSVL